MSSRLEEEFRESLFPDMVPSRQALRSQSGPGAGVAFFVTTSALTRIEFLCFGCCSSGAFTFFHRCPMASVDVAVPPTLLAIIAQLAGGRGCWEEGGCASANWLITS